VDRLDFLGPNGIAFRAVGNEIAIPEGGRYTSLLLRGGTEGMVSNESVLDYSGDNYTKPILGNPLSFEEAGASMSRIDGQELERYWLRAWRGTPQSPCL
jgi:hypothetical protein